MIILSLFFIINLPSCRFDLRYSLLFLIYFFQYVESLIRSLELNAPPNFVNHWLQIQYVLIWAHYFPPGLTHILGFHIFVQVTTLGHPATKWLHWVLFLRLPSSNQLLHFGDFCSMKSHERILNRGIGCDQMWAFSIENELSVEGKRQTRGRETSLENNNRWCKRWKQ